MPRTRRPAPLSPAPTPLPGRPNLEHLKGQARTLLRAIHAGQPDAAQRLARGLPGLKANPAEVRLADAQWLLAREYGFPSWPRLRAFVQAQGDEQAQVDNTSARPPSARQTFVGALAAELRAASGDAPALGARFARLPLRDILAAREELTRSGALAGVVDGLVAGLEHPHPRVRFDCAGALDHLADDRCVLPLRALLRDPVPRVRRAALHTLTCDACKPGPLTPGGDLGGLLLDVLAHDPSVRVRRSAVPLLGAFGTEPRVLDRLQVLAADRDAVIAREARWLLRRLGTVSGP